MLAVGHYRPQYLFSGRALPPGRSIVSVLNFNKTTKLLVFFGGSRLAHCVHKGSQA